MTQLHVYTASKNSLYSCIFGIMFIVRLIYWRQNDLGADGAKSDKIPIIPGGPPKNGTVDTVDFSGLCSDQQLSFFTLLNRASFPHYTITPRSSNLVENFILFYEKFLMDCHFRNLPDFQSFEARLMTASAAHAPTHASIQPATKKSQCQWRAWIVNPC